jgi:hypothetical protein
MIGQNLSRQIDDESRTPVNGLPPRSASIIRNCVRRCEAAHTSLKKCVCTNSLVAVLRLALTRPAFAGHAGNRPCVAHGLRLRRSPACRLADDLVASGLGDDAQLGLRPARARRHVEPGLKARGLGEQRGHAELVGSQMMLFKQGRSASPRQNCTRGRCCRRRSWPVHRPAPGPGSPPGSSAIGETSTRCADSPSPTSCCRRR